MEKINTDSLQEMKGYAEPALLEYGVGDRFQFLRKGYFIIDTDTKAGDIILNRIVGLKDSWAKAQKDSV